MTKSVFEALWKQMRGQVKSWWNKFTDDDLERVAGNYDQFLGLIQTRYSYTRQQAEEEFDQRRASLREILAKRVEKEFERRLAKIQTRQQNYDLTR